MDEFDKVMEFVNNKDVGGLYDYVANNYHNFNNYLLKDLLLEAIGTIYDQSSDTLTNALMNNIKDRLE